MRNDDLLTTAEVAAILDRSVSQVNRLASTGRLPVALKADGLRGARWFHRHDVDAFAARELEPAS